MKKLVAFLALALAAGALPSCGSSSSGSGDATASDSGSLKIRANPGNLLKYEPSTAAVKAGNVTIDFSNPQGEYHDVAVESTTNFEVVGITKTVAEGKASATVELEPGTYRYFCTVPHHREAGMEGTLTVK